MRPDKYTFTGNSFTEEMSENMKEEINKMILRVFRLNTMSDEDVIKELLKDEEVFDLLSDPSETVIEAYKFKYEL